jgi:hypothetical protein
VTLPDYRSHRNPLAGHCRHLPDLGAETLQSPYRGEPQRCVIGPGALDVQARVPLGCDVMGTLQQTTQRKPAMVILTEIVRVTMPAARWLEATEESTRLPRPIDPDGEAGRGRFGDCY